MDIQLFNGLSTKLNPFLALFQTSYGLWKGHEVNIFHVWSVSIPAVAITLSPRASFCWRFLIKGKKHEKQSKKY